MEVRTNAALVNGTTQQVVTGWALTGEQGGTNGTETALLFTQTKWRVVKILPVDELWFRIKIWADVSVAALALLLGVASVPQ